MLHLQVAIQEPEVVAVEVVTEGEEVLVGAEGVVEEEVEMENNPTFKDALEIGGELDLWLYTS